MTRISADKKTLLAAFVILCAVLASYYNALSNGFAYDDIYVVQTNPILTSLKNIPAIFTTAYWTPVGLSGGGLYRPITILSYLIERSMAGTDPWLYHFDNVLLHFACCVLVYLIVRRIAADEPASVAAALLFAVHPVHVEAVSNVVGRAELLASLFTLSGFYCFIRQRGRIPWYVVSPAMFLLGLLSKETAAVLPLLIAVYILLFRHEGRGGGLRRTAVSLLPFAVVALAYLLVRVLVISEGLYPKGAEQVLLTTTGYSRLLVMLKVFAGYIRLSLFPTSLYSHYMLRPPDSFLDPWVLLFVSVTAALFAASYRLIGNGRVYVLFFAWFFIAFLPVSNIIPIGIMMSERSMYLPTVSVCAVGGLMFSRAAYGTRPGGRLLPALAAFLLVTVLSSLGLQTHERNKVWRDEKSIYLDLVRSYNKVLRDFPESGQYHYHMSVAFMTINRMDEALAEVRKAVALDPGNDAYRAALHRGMARMLMKSGDDEAALTELGRAEELDKGSPDVYYMRGIVMGRLGEYAQAAALLEKAAALMPGDPPVHYYLATAYIGAGRDADAVRELEIAIRLNPDYAEARELLERRQ